MAGPSGDKPHNSIAVWLWISIAVLLFLGGALWLVASNRIVFYTAPIFHILGKPWGWIPLDYTQQVAYDLDAMYHLARRYPTRITIADWLGYAHTTLRPLSILLVIWVLGMGLRLIVRRSQAHNFQRKLTPDRLVHELMHFTTDIAPIACIQNKLVQNKLKSWRRQVSPMEVLKSAKVNGVSVIEPGMALNEERLAQYLASYTFIDVPAARGSTERIRFSKYLGRQIVDLAVDAKDTDRVFVDRMSSIGKAMFAVLAPGAFDGAEGRDDAEVVVRALNLSAYGSSEGTARLDVPEVQRMYDRYRDHPTVKQLLQVHHWEYTFLFELQQMTGRSSKLGSHRYLWLRPMNRILFFILDTFGRHTPHAESAVAVFGQHPFERLCMENGYLPQCEVHAKDKEAGERGKYMPIIFVSQVVAAFKMAFDEWVTGVADDHLDQMWQSKDIWAMARQTLGDYDAPAPPPREALTEDSEFDRVAAKEVADAAAAETARMKQALEEAAE